MLPDELEFRPENAHVVNHSGMTVLVAAKTMSLFTMDPLSEAVLQYCESKRRFTLEDVVKQLAQPAGEFVGEDVAHVVREFMNVDVLMGGQNSAPTALPFVDTEKFPLSSLVLNVTNKCNLHCTYCYEPDGAKYGPAPVRMEWNGALEQWTSVREGGAKPRGQYRFLRRRGAAQFQADEAGGRLRRK